MNAITVHAGPMAIAHLKQHGLRAADIAVIPAAAGGPKGLILQAFDQWLFGEWLPSAPRPRSLIGASIGAWRMAAACHADPATAFRQLSQIYCGQRYPRRPTARHVTDVCRAMLQDWLGGRQSEVVAHPTNRMHLITSRSRVLLPTTSPERGRQRHAIGFAAAMLTNLVSRDRLARHFDRVIISDRRDDIGWLTSGFDAFDTVVAPLAADNLIDGLLASGTLPMVMDPVKHIAHAPTGNYWDGGLIDYHLALPYARLNDRPDGGLVLYPHFHAHLIPGWFDKPLRWRQRGAHRAWLDNVIVVAPSQSFLANLPRGKLPDRSDFKFHGLDHDCRTAAWQQAIGEGERLRDAFAHFQQTSDLSMVEPL